MDCKKLNMKTEAPSDWQILIKLIAISIWLTTLIVLAGLAMHTKSLEYKNRRELTNEK